MELKTLFIGMFISMAAFSVKAGMGWAYLRRSCRGRKAFAATAAMLAGYAALFAAVYLIVTRVDVLANYDTLIPLLQGGVTLHRVMAAFIFVWGLSLLRMCHHDGQESGSKAWIALAVPCPVCVSAVLMSASCLALYFPDDAAYAVAGLFALFVAVGSISGLVVSLSEASGKLPLEAALGQAMIMVSLYFIVSALVMPQFAEISKVYRLAAYSGETRNALSSEALGTVAVIVTLCASGFFYARRKFARLRSLES